MRKIHFPPCSFLLFPAGESRKTGGIGSRNPQRHAKKMITFIDQDVLVQLRQQSPRLKDCFPRALASASSSPRLIDPNHSDFCPWESGVPTEADRSRRHLASIRAIGRRKIIRSVPLALGTALFWCFSSGVCNKNRGSPKGAAVGVVNLEHFSVILEFTSLSP